MPSMLMAELVEAGALEDIDIEVIVDAMVELPVSILSVVVSVKMLYLEVCTNVGVEGLQEH